MIGEVLRKALRYILNQLSQRQSASLSNKIFHDSTNAGTRPAATPCGSLIFRMSATLRPFGQDPEKRRLTETIFAVN